MTENVKAFTPVKFSLPMKLGILLCSVALVVLYNLPIYGFADTKPVSFTDLFSTTAFSGSMEIIQKLNWVGWILNGIITVTCFLGAVFVVIVTVFSILYLAGSPLFDAVAEVKKAGKGTGKAGFSGMFKEVSQGNWGSGLDVVFGFILMLIPDVRRISDYREGSTKYRLNAEEDTIAQYLLKVGFHRILVIFFCAIGFSGTLWQGFAKCADAMAYTADRIVSVNLTGYIDNLVAQMQYYTFEFDATGTNYGDLMQSIAKDTYVQVLKKCPGADDDVKALLGKNIENWINSNFYAGSESDVGEILSEKRNNPPVAALLQKMCNAGETVDNLFAEPDKLDAAVKRVTSKVSISRIPIGATIQVPSNDLASGLAAEEFYLNITLNHKAVNQLGDYFVLPGPDAPTPTQETSTDDSGEQQANSGQTTYGGN